jgi:hypothetical protein
LRSQQLLSYSINCPHFRAELKKKNEYYAKFAAWITPPFHFIFIFPLFGYILQIMVRSEAGFEELMFECFAF